MKYTDNQKLKYFGKRVSDKTLTKNQRQYAQKRYKELFLKNSSLPRFSYNYRKFLGLPYKNDFDLLTIDQLYSSIKSRKIINLRRNTKTKKRTKIIKFLNDKEHELDLLTVKNNLDLRSTVIVTP